MKLKNFTLKTLAALAFMLLAFAVNAQQTETLGVTTNFNYEVDVDPANGGATPDGTLGSSYAWTLPDGGGTFVADALPNDNKATINWSTAAVGTYRVRVVETNASCPTDTEEFTVTITTPLDPDLDWADAPTPICEGDVATFVVTNAPVGAVISYTATGGTPTTGTATVLAGGTVTIPITHVAPATQVTLTLTSMSVGTNTVTFTTPITATAQVNIVETSPIQLVP